MSGGRLDGKNVRGGGTRREGGVLSEGRVRVRRAARLAFALAVASALAAPGAAPAMSAEEFAEKLRKARRPEAERVAAFAGEVDESSPEFLDGGTYYEATLHGPEGAEALRFVLQRDRMIAIPSGAEARRVLTSQVRVSIRTPEAAIAYVQWLLRLEASGGFWLVASLDDVPFQRTRRDETALRERIEAARERLAAKIAPPRAEEGETGFVVTQDAVAGTDLVRHVVKVSRLGLPWLETTTVESDLPVVYVGR